jgi:hypothetical protein
MLKKAQTITEYRVYEKVISFKPGTSHNVVRFKKWSGTRREIAVIFGSKTGTHNLNFGRVLFAKNIYVRVVLPMQIILPFEVMLLSTGKGQDRGKDT